MKKTALILGIILIFSFTACDDFFSSTWGSPRNFDPSNISVNSRNVNDWIKRSVGNPSLADAVTQKIIQELPNASPADKAALVNGGVILAVEASGIGTSILNNAMTPLKDLVDNMIDGGDTSEMTGIMIQVMNNVQADFIRNGGRNNAVNLATIINLGDPSDISNPADLAFATVVLTLAVLDDNGINANSDLFEGLSALADELDDIDYSSGSLVYTGGGSNPKAQALVSCINAFENLEGDDFISGILKDLFYQQP